MIHYEISADALQPHVPFALDLFGGSAYVSLVAFTMRRLRFARTVPAWVTAPIATHGFLNVRTYVRHGGEPGIFFLNEYLSNRLSVWLGPILFGLPYRLGRLEYDHEDERVRGRMVARARLEYCGRVAGEFQSAKPQSLEEFLFERYSAFTFFLGFRRRFRVWHEPWTFAPLDLRVESNGLIGVPGARLTGAHFSRGFRDVWMGRPRQPPMYFA